jgi:outer membrane protein assembly factor BamE (lipoprotein component of BamABCDE complex)
MGMSRRMMAKTSGLKAAVLVPLLALGVAACEPEVINRGHQFDDRALDQIRPGASAQQVLLVLGTPSTVATVGGKVYYYISQRLDRRFQFMGETIRDQRVVAVYIGRGDKVERVANYGLQDGVVFDFITRTTPSGGEELSILRQLLRASNLTVPIGG